MSDRESSRDAIARRMLEIATYNELTGNVPMPRPRPAGAPVSEEAIFNDWDQLTDMQKLRQRQQELKQYGLEMDLYEGKPR